MIRVLLADPFATTPDFVRAIVERAPLAEVRVWRGNGDPSADLLVAWALPDDYPAVPPTVKALFCFGAGIDQLVHDPRVPAELPIIRSLDEGQAEHMADYVLATAYASLVGLPRHRRSQEARRWPTAAVARRHAGEHTVTVLGTGFIGKRVIAQLLAAGFPVRAWSRSGRPVPRATVWAGPERLADAVAGSDLLVNILPLAPDTNGIIDRRLLGLLAPGAGLVNIARGGHLNEPDLRAMLDEGHLDQCWLDTVEQEPPPADSWLWAHPRVTLTPHVAGPPDVIASADSLARVIEALNRNEAPPGLVRGTLDAARVSGSPSAKT